MENLITEAGDGNSKENKSDTVSESVDGNKENLGEKRINELAVNNTVSEELDRTQNHNNIQETGPVKHDDVSTEKPDSNNISFTAVYNKNKYDITFDSSKTIRDLKDHLQNLIGVPQSLQKIMIKGLAKDNQTLKDLDVKTGMKVMVVGSKLDQILAASSGPSSQELPDEKSTNKEPLCKQKAHGKVLGKGVPDDVMVGIKNVKDPLPPTPLSGMLNKSGGKVRLTFKMEIDQLWISTKERTEKVTMNSIKHIISEPIEGHEEYHIMGLQMGPTEASRYWIYWVPAQYVDAIKHAILGTWLF